PYGQLLPGMAYLVRRLLENTSNESFLRASFTDQRPEDQLLMNPLQTRNAELGTRNGDTHSEFRVPSSAFRNEPPADFSREENRPAMAAALRDVSGRFNQRYPLVIDGKEIDPGNWADSFDPSNSKGSVGKFAMARTQDAEAAIAASVRAFAGWRDTPVKERAEFLFRAAAGVRKRRFELSAWGGYEGGKPWREADADIAEAIDFCEYYGREMLRLDKPQRRDVLGEENEYFYEPRGVTVVIAPWNFPLAILCGMTSAALVAGNTVIMKPAEQS